MAYLMNSSVIRALIFKGNVKIFLPSTKFNINGLPHIGHKLMVPLRQKTKMSRS